MAARPEPLLDPEPDPRPDGAVDRRPALVVLPDTGQDTSSARIVRRRSSYVRVEQVDAPRTPVWVRTCFGLMYLMALLLAGHQLWGWGGPDVDVVVNHGFNNAIFIGAGLLTAWRAVRFRSERAAWACIAAGLLLYCAGDVIWSAFFADSDAPVTLADAFYLCYSPLMLLGVALLVRRRISRFELGRWIDGLAAALLVSAPAVVFILEPMIRASTGNFLTKVVSVAYPLGDIVVLGAAVGVFALAGWHPGRAWVVLALGLSVFVAADSIYSVELLTDSYALGAYDFLWPTAGLLIATAAWLQPVRHREVHAWGWRAIALPVLCQVAPIALVLMGNNPPSEQLLTTAVLAIVLVQLVVTRPRRPVGLE